MARIRTVKPEFWKDEDINELPESTQLLALALLNYADDEGYFNANEKLIRSVCLPLRDPSVPLPKMLQQLAEMGYIRLGKTKDKKSFGHITNFTKHQKVNHKKLSEIRELDIAWEDSLKINGTLSEDGSLEGKGKEQGTGKGKEGKKDVGASPTSPHPASEQRIVLNYTTKKFDGITKADLTDWAKAYPDVDISQTLERIRLWCVANPQKVKPRQAKGKKGLRATIQRWLSGDQEKYQAAANFQKAKGVQTGTAPTSADKNGKPHKLNEKLMSPEMKKLKEKLEGREFADTTH